MATQYISDFTATWNNGATVFHGIKLNVTDTASSAGSRLFTFQVGGTDKIYALKSGALVSASTLTGTGLNVTSGGTIDFASSNVVLTHSTGVLTVSTGDLRVATAGTHDDSVVTVAGVQTLVNKTISGGAGAGYDSIGSYAFLTPGTGSSETYEGGDTLAGSALIPVGVEYNDTNFYEIGGSTMSGTWQCMGYSKRGSGTANSLATLWVRIA